MSGMTSGDMDVDDMMEKMEAMGKHTYPALVFILLFCSFLLTYVLYSCCAVLGPFSPMGININLSLFSLLISICLLSPY